MKTLFQSFALSKNLILKNRIAMAPMTRNMANDDLSPTQAMADYYARRADTGLIITEGTFIRPDARGYSHVPGIFTESQIKAWRLVTEAVHKKEGHIFLQIWHVGRVSHPSFLNGELPIAPSETSMTGRVWRSPGLHFGKSRAASIAEIHGLIASYATAAENAMRAGFDGVEIHGANGYLVDQFLHYHTNHRHDAYGGTSENNARFALEVIEACGKAIGFEKVGIRLSPGAYLNEIEGDPRDAATFQYLLQALNIKSLAYIHTGNFNDKKLFPELNDQTMTSFMRRYYQGTLMASGGYSVDEAENAVKNQRFDLVSIGRPFIANPNLIDRLLKKSELNSYNPEMLNTLF